MSRRWAYALVISACVLPRIATLLYERGDILASYTEKGDDFARTFVATGTFGFVPGEPSAWVQPLYGFFLIPIYWIFGRGWAAVGLAQIAVAVGAAVLVYETGRRFISPRAGLVAALIATLNPYLIWHDVHLNREILDTFLATAVVYLTLLGSDRRSRRGLSLAALTGLALGLAILANTRLVFLPLVIAVFLAWQTRAWAGPALCVGACALTVLPWAVRNDVSVGCFTLTTDTKALWKANNPRTYATLASGKWIDDVPDLPGAPYTPEEASTLYYGGGTRIHVDECAQMSFYRRQVIDFWRDEPGEKAKLSGQAVRMLWDPRVFRTEGRPEAGGAVDRARTWVQPLYQIPLYALALVGLFLIPRRVAVLIVALLLYQTLAAVGFAGATRYRVAWDFTLALAASATLVQLAGWLSSRARARSAGPTPAEPSP